MRKSISKLYTPIIVFLIITFLVSCGEEINPGVRKLSVYEQSSVLTDFPFVTIGDALTFHLQRSAQDRKDVIDDEFSEEFLIQINTQENSFSYSSNSLAIYDLPIVYRQYCFCLGFNRVSMTQFEIAGNKKSNGDWQVKGDVTLILQYVDNQSMEVIDEREWDLNISGLYVKSSKPN